MSERKIRNTCLDFLKGIACIFVVFMHCEFPGKLGVLVQCISRFCVPFFFMVSGYFAFRPNGKKSQYAAKIKHIALITLYASVFYVLVAILTHNVSGVSVKALLGFAVLNQPVVIAGQLWFLFALLYDYILWAIVDRYDLYRFAYPAIPVLMLVYICLAQGAHLAGIHVPNLIYRNFLIEGFPFFMLGHRIHRNQDRIQITNRALFLVFIAATLLCPVERILMGRDFGLNIVTFPQVTALFLLGVKNPTFGADSLLTKFGLLYSMFIYILHPFVMGRLNALYSKIGLAENTAALYAKPILVLLCTIVFAAIVIWLRDQFFKRQVKA